MLFLHLGLILMLAALGFHHVEVDTRLILTAFLCSILVTAARFQIQRFFRPPAWMRWVLLPALISAPPFSLISLPIPISVLVPVFALAWIFRSRRVVQIPIFSQGLILFLVAWRLLSLEAALPVFEFPRFPSSTPVWIGIAITIPLGIATQVRLRGFAKQVILAGLTFVFLAASLIPLILQTATGFKEIGEPGRDFYRISPLPGFTKVPGVGIQELLPSEFRKFSEPYEPVQILNQMNLALQPKELKKVSGELDPDQALLLLQQTGFLLKDRHGFFVPEITFSNPEPPEGMDHSFMKVVQRLATHASYAASGESRDILLRLRNLNFVDTIPGNSSRFRLTPQARHRFSNGLYPRQILSAHAINAVSLDFRPRIWHSTYEISTYGWGLSFDKTRSEMIELVDAGALRVDDSLVWNFSALHVFDVDKRSLGGAFAFVVLGILLVGTGSQCQNGARHRITAFALGVFCVAQFPGVPASETSLVVQAVWATVFLPISSILIVIAIR
jgi:hypothetical protein